ncbi:hypothetical protein C7974DRAFT_310415 [Boeremia exigua]|uniref:uncharacterized protein n=1 Tax=Boeremia exigua TaxID=749465 RepID=UPI001E8CB82C|nr:uncharacterized protein C7974DRAFT_310415 [Boeremia exigua]KAH6632933.1 hypothetical protein C7974DRAFT_310415 [Boeremia exigua]
MSPNPGAQPTDALSSLGIRLLELCFGNALESMPIRKTLSPGDTVTAPVLDWAAAMQWSKMASDEAGPEFAGAIEWCLRANELTNTNWRKDFVQNVLCYL